MIKRVLISIILCIGFTECNLLLAIGTQVKKKIRYRCSQRFIFSPFKLCFLKDMEEVIQDLCDCLFCIIFSILFHNCNLSVDGYFIQRCTTHQVHYLHFLINYFNCGFLARDYAELKVSILLPKLKKISTSNSEKLMRI